MTAQTKTARPCANRNEPNEAQDPNHISSVRSTPPVGQLLRRASSSNQCEDGRLNNISTISVRSEARDKGLLETKRFKGHAQAQSHRGRKWHAFRACRQCPARRANGDSPDDGVPSPPTSPRDLSPSIEQQRSFEMAGLTAMSTFSSRTVYLTASSTTLHRRYPSSPLSMES